MARYSVNYKNKTKQNKNKMITIKLQMTLSSSQIQLLEVPRVGEFVKFNGFNMPVQKVIWDSVTQEVTVFVSNPTF